MKSIFKCRACGNSLKRIGLNEYIQCERCSSYNLISGRAGNRENNEYFNKIYNEVNSFRVSYLKNMIYRFFSKIDYKIKIDDYENYFNSRININKIFLNKKVCEIGFGEGANLFNLLSRGIDAYGIDISKTAVNNFKKKHPEYMERVSGSLNLMKKTDVIYCSALFEHLENPEVFLADSKKILNKKGIIILDSLPVLNVNGSDLDAANDINFWRPHHRVIYSVKGLINLFSNFNFRLLKYALLDDFNYRVLSVLNQMGFEAVRHLRNPVLAEKNLPGPVKFSNICRRALKIKSLALSGLFIFKKINGD